MRSKFDFSQIYRLFFEILKKRTKEFGVLAGLEAGVQLLISEPGTLGDKIILKKMIWLEN